MRLDMEKLRAAGAEPGCRPATTDDEHLDKLRADSAGFDLMNAHDPPGPRAPEDVSPRIGKAKGYRGLSFEASSPIATFSSAGLKRRRWIPVSEPATPQEDS